MEPTEGSRGARVHVVHPSLLDPAGRAQIVFGDAEPLIPVRGRPGYATTYVPWKLTSATELDVVLLVDGEETARFPFSVTVPAAVSSTPGATVLEAMTLLRQATATLPSAVSDVSEALAFEGDEADALLGLTTALHDELKAATLQFEATFATLDPETRGSYEEIALANGLSEVVASLSALVPETEPEGTQQGALSVSTTASLIELVCLIGEVTEAAQTVADINKP